MSNDLEKFGTIGVWSEELHIAPNSLKLRLDPSVGIEGKDVLGRVNLYYAESVVRQACADLLEVPQADESGFFMFTHGERQERYGTTGAWGRELGIDGSVIRKRLKERTGIAGRGWTGKVTENGFYPESLVRELCQSVIDAPHAEDRFITRTLDGGKQERYGTITAWSQEIGLSEATLRRKLRGVPPFIGRLSEQRATQIRMYAESDVRRLCAHLLVELPQADANGFCLIEGERHGTLLAWYKELKIDRSVLKRKLANEQGVTAKNCNGSVEENGFFAESALRRNCTLLLQNLPIADDNGFFVALHNGQMERHGTINAWARALNLTNDLLQPRLRKHVGITARTSRGNVREKGFYPESVVREACKDVIAQKTSTATYEASESLPSPGDGE